jgi:para-aminobenzoate synthetase component 1
MSHFRVAFFMTITNRLPVFDQMNKLGKAKTPFLFVLDFELKKPFVLELHEIDPNEVKYAVEDGFLEYRNFEIIKKEKLEFKLKKTPLDFSTYSKAFSIVKENLSFGNSFLCNLTAETPIEINLELDELLDFAHAKYKLFVKNQFVCFSPETFIQIRQDGVMASQPMKGTIDAEIENATEVILANKKEKYEHTTIVDLIRNDVSSVAEKVWVERFRYLESIKKEDGKKLLQVSSEIRGQLGKNWNDHLGTIFEKLLPAGSISGAPKDKTLEIIRQAERLTYKSGERGYYTGIFGIFNGEAVTSAVMIRYIEKRNEQLFFKSGGGITSRSNAQAEYEELISKIYVPLH